MSAVATLRRRADQIAATRFGAFLRLVRLLWTVDARTATFLAGQYAQYGLDKARWGRAAPVIVWHAGVA